MFVLLIVVYVFELKLRETEVRLVDRRRLPRRGQPIHQQNWIDLGIRPPAPFPPAGGWVVSFPPLLPSPRFRDHATHLPYGLMVPEARGITRLTIDGLL